LEIDVAFLGEQVCLASVPLLEITNLRKSYVAPNGTRLDVIDVPRFEPEAGEQMALAGASGSGKTTFWRSARITGMAVSSASIG
jgi:ABC-type glutathione transport system ATPase component